MTAFWEPTSVGLMIISAVSAVLLTATTAVLWDRRGGWIVLRISGPVVGFLLLSVAALIAINRPNGLFQTWSELWGFLR